MKETATSLNNGHRLKVANSTAQDQSAINSKLIGSSGGVDKQGKVQSVNTNSNPNSTNFDDDYNEWELGIGDLIIDLDADIEKNNDHSNDSITTDSSKNSNSNNLGESVNSTSASTTSSPTTTTTFNNSLSPTTSIVISTPSKMSNSKSPKINNSVNLGGNSNSINNNNTASNNANASSSSSSNPGHHHHHHHHHHHYHHHHSSSSSSAANTVSTVEHQATVDNGLKMKIKRKNIGGKSSEAKHEIVQSDINPNLSSKYVSSLESSESNVNSNLNANTATLSNSNQPSTTSSTSNSTLVSNNLDSSKSSKHSSSKGKNSNHRDKKDKNREKVTSSSCKLSSLTNSDLNGLLTNSNVAVSLSPSSPSSSVVTSCTSPLTTTSSLSNISSSSHTSSSNVATYSTTNSCSNNLTNSNVTHTSNDGTEATLPTSQKISLSASSNHNNDSNNVSLKFASSFNPSVIIKSEDISACSLAKKLKLEANEKTDTSTSMPSVSTFPEMKSISTCTSVGTVTEPDCLGPCEPGTSVTLEGIVWQETDGGVLVVNVTWRGKTYVGTLLDCTKHDWAPPRFCESPTSDMETKSNKSSRSKRGRGSISDNSIDLRNVQSKLRNGKGRRTANSGFTAPTSQLKPEPASNVNGNKRKARSDLELSPNIDSAKSDKRNNRSQSSRNTPTPNNSNEIHFSTQPSSPALIECPEPNCSKKYKHINGLKYHQTHAHGLNDLILKVDREANESGIKDQLNVSDCEENIEMSNIQANSLCSKIVSNSSYDNSDNLSPTLDIASTSNYTEPKMILNSATLDSSISGELKTESSFEASMQSSLLPNTTQVNSGFSSSLLSSTSNAFNTSSSVNSDNSATFLVPQASILSSNGTNNLNANNSEEKVIKVQSESNMVKPNNTTASLTTLTTTITTTAPALTPLVTNANDSINIGSDTLKKDKSKHKKKSKDKEKAKDKNKKIYEPASPSTSDANKEDNMDDVSFKVKQDPSPVLDNQSSSISSPALSSSSTELSEMKGELASETTTIENVQSPAYSDISDADDKDAVMKDVTLEKSENICSPSSVESSNSTPNPSSGFGMYPFFNQSPYLISVGTTSGSTQMSPIPSNQTSSSSQQLSSNTSNQSQSNKNLSKNETVIDKKVPTESSRNDSQKRSSETEAGVGERKREEGVRTSANLPPTVLNSSALGPEFTSSLTSSAYPYPYNYLQGYPGYSIDSAYHMHLLVNDPHYKQQYERLVSEHERMFKEQSEKGEGLEKRAFSASLGLELSLKQPSRSSSSSKLVDSLNLINSDTGKDKMSENHIILKENADLIPQMEKSKLTTSGHHSQSKFSSSPYENIIFDKSKEDVSRFYHSNESQTGDDTSSTRLSHSVLKRDDSLSSKDNIKLESSKSSQNNKNLPLHSISSSSSSSSTVMSSQSLSGSASSPKFNRDSFNSSSSSSFKDASKQKEKFLDDRENRNKFYKPKEEGVKPTMETTGPPPPPTSSYYLHSSFLQHPSTHSFAPPSVAFDPAHPMVRPGSLNPSMIPPFSAPSPYLHPQLRFPLGPPPPHSAPHTTGSLEMSPRTRPPAPLPPPGSSNIATPPSSQIPNDLSFSDKVSASSTPSTPNKALDLLHQVSQHYTSHKIHELQDRTIMSPALKTSGSTNSSPNNSSRNSASLNSASNKSVLETPTPSLSLTKGDLTRSPPPQRHLHTHHHTHVGVGYPIYDPYGAMIASQQVVAAAAVGINPFVPK